MAIFVGIILAATGFGMVWKTEWLINNFGHIGWAEAHLGSSGGTRLFYKLLGIIIIIAGFFSITGLHQGILRSFILPLFGIRGKA